MPVEWDVNYIAVVVAAVVGMVIGAVYYMPQVVGKAWMNAIGKTEEDLPGANRPWTTPRRRKSAGGAAGLSNRPRNSFRMAGKPAPEA